MVVVSGWLGGRQVVNFNLNTKWPVGDCGWAADRSDPAATASLSIFVVGSSWEPAEATEAARAAGTRETSAQLDR